MESFAGVIEVAEWLGVTSSAVSQWINQPQSLLGYPEADVSIGGSTRRYLVYGWHWHRKGEWIAWKESR